MINLIFASLCVATIGHLFRLRERLAYSVFPMLAANYLLAVTISFVRMESYSELLLPSGAVVLAVSLGALFIICYLLMNYVITKLGISLTVSLSRLSLVIPTLGSIFLFSEAVTGTKLPGLIIAFLILPFSAKEIPDRENIRRLLHGGLGWGLLMFLLFGLNDFIFKLKGEFYRGVDNNAFLVYVYLISFILSLLFIKMRRSKVSLSTLGLGLLFGCVNYLAAHFFLLAVEELPGMLAYPLNGILIILITTTSSIFIWRERLKRHNLLFLAGAIVAIWLLF